MKIRLCKLLLLIGIFSALPLVVYAHHSWSEYDAKIQVLITGTVSKVEWKSPHARLYVDVVEAGGQTVNWNIELPSPNTLMRRGWKRHDVQAGDQVQVTGIRARNYPHIGIATSVLDGDGAAMFSGTVTPNE